MRKHLILRQFIGILGQLDKKFSQSNAELAEFEGEASENNKNGLSQQAEESVGEGEDGLPEGHPDLKQEELESGFENHPDNY